MGTVQGRHRALVPRPAAATRGVVLIVMGTGIGQGIAALASPVLSRMYSPHDFGVFAIVSALATVFSALPTLRYELAVPLPVDDRDGRALVGGALGLCVLFTIVATLLLVPMGNLAASLFHEPALKPFLLAIPLLASTMAAFRLLNQWALRRQEYMKTARRNALQGAATVSLQVAGGLRNAGGLGLILGYGLGQALGSLSLSFRADLRLRTVAWHEITRNLRRYRRFAYLLASAGVINSAGYYLPILAVGAYFGPSAAGFVGFAQRILGMPLALVGQAVSQVYVSEVSKARRTGRVADSKLFWKASRRLTALSLMLCLIIVVFSPIAFDIIFGQRWKMSGEVAQALAPMIAFQFVASPISQTLVVLERAVVQLLWDAGRLAATAAVIVVAAQYGATLLTTMWLVSGVSCLAYATAWELSRRTIRMHS